MKRSCLVHILSHAKVECLDFPMKIDNLASILLNCCEKGGEGGVSTTCRIIICDDYS